jgi:hypothetical protein
MELRGSRASQLPRTLIINLHLEPDGGDRGGGACCGGAGNGGSCARCDAAPSRSGWHGSGGCSG